MQEAEISRILVQGQSEQKIHEKQDLEGQEEVLIWKVHKALKLTNWRKTGDK
jgi:hypothetical protein